jgi:cell division protein FtsL
MQSGGDFWSKLPSAATVITAVVAAVLIWEGVLRGLFRSQKEVADVEKDRVKQRDEKIEDLNGKLKDLTEAYKIALLEVDTSRGIRSDYRERIKALEGELRNLRGLRHDEPDLLHRTET